MSLIRGGMRIESRAAAGLIAARLARPRLMRCTGRSLIIDASAMIPVKALLKFHACVLRSHPDVILASSTFAASCNACGDGALCARALLPVPELHAGPAIRFGVLRLCFEQVLLLQPLHTAHMMNARAAVRRRARAAAERQLGIEALRVAARGHARDQWWYAALLPSSRHSYPPYLYIYLS